LVTPDRRQLWRAMELAERIRVLDGLYVALAEQRECPLLTSDARLAAADPPCEVLLVPTAGP
jgi:predicted nucleic acid-binding protein